MKDGTEVLLRPELSTDLEMLWDMFSTLSRDTLKFLPIPFTRERVEGWIENIDYEKALPILGIVRENGADRIIASATLSFSSSQTYRHVATLGITVHDDYQNRGLGTLLLQRLIDIAGEKGIKKIKLDVVTHNSRAIHLYEKFGFEVEGHMKMNHYNYVLDDYGDDYVMALFL